MGSDFLYKQRPLRDMEDPGDRKHPENGGESETGVNYRHVLLVAAFSLIAIAPVYRLDLTLQTLFDMNVTSIIQALIPLLLLFPVPAAYIASISKNGFRKEALGAAVTLPLAAINLQLAAAAAGLFLGSIMVSYKAKSIYNGRNTNWVHFKSVGSMVTITAITVGLTTAAFYGGTPAFREDIRGNLTQYSVDTALEYADVAGLSMPTGDEAGTVSGGQVELASGFAGTLAQNISRTTITSTENVVFAAVQESQQQDGNTFDTTEQSMLRGAFDTAENTIPDEVSAQTEQQLQNQFTTTPTSGEDGSGSGTLRNLVTPRVRSFVDQMITNSQEMMAVAFVAAFSMVMLFKLPIEFLGAIYAAILSKVF